MRVQLRRAPRLGDRGLLNVRIGISHGTDTGRACFHIGEARPGGNPFPPDAPNAARLEELIACDKLPNNPECVACSGFIFMAGVKKASPQWLWEEEPRARRQTPKRFRDFPPFPPTPRMIVVAQIGHERGSVGETLGPF